MVTIDPFLSLIFSAYEAAPCPLPSGYLSCTCCIVVTFFLKVPPGLAVMCHESFLTQLIICEPFFLAHKSSVRDVNVLLVLPAPFAVVEATHSHGFLARRLNQQFPGYLKVNKNYLNKLFF